MKRTVSIPVDLPSERFLPLMEQCAEIFNVHIDWAIANSTYNKLLLRFLYLKTCLVFAPSGVARK
ncbi:hypothetical protein VB735_13910 [Halotia wernerae UHCC 0503]|nr:hypothetical protein [Halotia wernerae UHCC 0503]